jgi:hypothetical protein
VVGQLDPAHRKEWAKVKPRQVVTILCFCKGSEKADVSRDVRVVLEMVRLK